MNWDWNIFWDIVVTTLVLSTMLVGLFGLVVPIMPGLVIIWIAALGWGLFAGFGTLGWIMFAIMTVLMIVGSFVDNVLMGAKAHKGGAAWWAILIALVAALVGNAFLPVIGGILAAFLALFLVEWARRKDSQAAWVALKSMMVGYGWSIAIRLLVGLVMIGLWTIWAWV